MFKCISPYSRIILIFTVIFTFSLILRFIWVYQFNDIESVKFNNQFMINTNDGYLYAKGVKDLLENKENSIVSTVNHPLSVLSATISNIFHIKYETTIFYISAFLSSLLGIPLFLISKQLMRIEFAFLSSIFASISWSYYNRTMVGYYDTDMLNIVFAIFLLWSLISTISSQKKIYIFITAFIVIFYREWYPQSYSLEFAFLFLIILYFFYKIIKKKEYSFELELIVIYLFSMTDMDLKLKLFLLIILYFVFKKFFQKYRYIFLSIAIVFFIFMGGIEPILFKINAYIFKSEITTSINEHIKLNFFSVKQTVKEAGEIPFEIFANRISGNIFIFIFSFFGLVLLLIKKPITVLSLPMIFLGFLAYGIPGIIPASGLRFTIYAVPILSISLFFLINELMSFFIKYIKNDTKIKVYINIFFVVCFTIIFFPNIKHIIEYKVPSVFSSDEVKSLNKLNKISSTDDYIISWWDYGYPIQYYTNSNILIDGGINKKSSDLFLVSYILNTTPEKSAYIARFVIEYRSANNNSNILNMMNKYSYKDYNDLLINMENLKVNKTREVFFYLPYKMLDIFSTIRLFSNINLNTGNKTKDSFFFKTRMFKEVGNLIYLSKNIALNKTTLDLSINNKKVSLKRFVTTRYNINKKLKTSVKYIDKYSNLNLIYMENYNIMLIVDDEIYNSLFFQLFILENYDNTLYEPVELAPLIKIYKLKI